MIRPSRIALSRFALATLVPAFLLAVAALAGGVWPLIAVLSMTALVVALDYLIIEEGPKEGVEFPAEPWLAQALAWVHFVLLALGVWALSGATGLGAGERLLLFVGLGLYFGQVSNSNAHELIHAGSKRLRRLGMWVYISMLYGHHASAHVRVHHVHVGTEADPASAEVGESFYAYARRAWVDGFRAGYEAEQDLTARGTKRRLNPYVAYVGGAVGMLALAGAIGGFGGVLALLGLAGYAQVQLLMSDYVQHYGLRRKTLHGTTLEPVGPQHSWNAPHWYSSALMMNAPRHSDHHVHPGKGYADLQLEDETPMLPYSLPVMATLALWPAGWRKVMDWRVVYWT
ncbi:hypothetical protein ATO11_03060 [Pseudaestuariivita atlantica]|uniref:Fatty acid desaturase domain-containing protein n=2 Tax=Pseudaestuariivita atlantica TaxID=1317121 RepID=A0A0L1JVH4_9RHOB|nr:hypothetical protein ATO11_03060 [Pseudaestuariivita atlantica]